MLKCLLPLNSLVAVPSAECGIYSTNYLQGQDKQNNWNDPEMEETLPITMFWKVVYAMLLSLNIGHPLPFSFSFICGSAYKSPSHTHVQTPHLSLFSFALRSSPSCLQNNAASILNTSLSPSLWLQKWISRVLPLCRGETSALVFQSAPVPLCIQTHSTTHAAVENKAQRCSLVFKAVTVNLQVHLGTLLGGKD